MTDTKRTPDGKVFASREEMLSYQAAKLREELYNLRLGKKLSLSVVLVLDRRLKELGLGGIL